MFMGFNVRVENFNRERERERERESSHLQTIGLVLKVFDSH